MGITMHSHYVNHAYLRVKNPDVFDLVNADVHFIGSMMSLLRANTSS